MKRRGFLAGLFATPAALAAAAQVPAVPPVAVPPPAAPMRLSRATTLGTSCTVVEQFFSISATMDVFSPDAFPDSIIDERE